MQFVTQEQKNGKKKKKKEQFPTRKWKINVIVEF